MGRETKLRDCTKHHSTALTNSDYMFLNIRHSRSRYACGVWMCECVHVWLFTQGPLENAARVSEACRPAHEVKGFRVAHNSPLSVVHRESGHFRTDQWFKVKGSGIILRW